MAFAMLLFSGQEIFATPQLTPSRTDDERFTLVYVPNVSGGITEINSADNAVFGTAPWAHGSNGGIAITPDGSAMYVSNHEVSSVSVFNTATNVPLAEIGVGLNPIGLAITPDGSHVYVANQNSDNVSVIAISTNSVVKTIAVGANPIWVTISSDGSRAYVSNQYSDTISVIATEANTVLASIPVGSLPFHSSVSPDGRFLWVSAQGENAVKVVDLSSNTVVSSIPAGPNPRGIAFTPDGSHAYVADFFSNTLAVIDVFERSLTGFVTVGSNPWNLGITPKGIAYVANFGDNTISVLDTSTNTVTTTLNGRTSPADVTITRRAQPLILGYTFQPIGPPGSLFSWVRGINNKGDVVGDYADANWVLHGFLRTHTGAFVTIDPQGGVGCQLCTSAFSINDLGVIVGAYRDSNNVLHGFRRSPSGVYTTVDFPGAPDSQLTGVNNRGHNSGVYDLGNLGSTHCPGPQCQAISFVLHSGVFSTFEDPVAAPQSTFAFSINDLDQTCGSFTDSAGNTHGFLRDPRDGSFETIQFPLADASSSVNQVNDHGTIAGEYNLRLPHGFLTDGRNFLSFDYPNSDLSGLRAVNNRGRVGGYFVVSGKFEAYIATPREE
jgi:YVTN family beta-propeller protein